MAKQSAGILAYRTAGEQYEVLLVHPGGPYWAKKELHSWSIPKGEFENAEEPFEAAKREFREETGFEIIGKFIDLEPVKQAGGKIIFSWAVEAQIPATEIKSNYFEMEWPPKSGNFKEFPEVDKAEWFPFDSAKKKILSGQLPILEQLERKLEINMLT